MDVVGRVKRSGIRARYAAVAFAAAACAPAFACPLEVIGTWRLVSPDEPQPMLVTFGADGWAKAGEKKLKTDGARSGACPTPHSSLSGLGE